VQRGAAVGVLGGAVGAGVEQACDDGVQTFARRTWVPAIMQRRNMLGRIQVITRTVKSYPYIYIL
jgi:hypothetical protein